jgi:DNA repair exonuclease SbcCD ATPase subunit
VFVDGDGGELSPLSASGGGAVDIAAFGLRLSLWTLPEKRTRGVIVLDEPFRFLSKDLHAKAGQAIKELSARLGLQFIIVTHENTLQESADKIFRVEKRRGVSKVTEE